MAESSGWRCIDFTRTRGWESRDRSDDELVSLDALVAWGSATGILEDAGGATSGGLSSPATDRAGELLEEARGLRGAVYRVLRDRALGDDPAPEDMATLNRWIGEAGAHRRLAAGTDEYRWRWEPSGASPAERILWAVAWSAAGLLAGEHSERLTLCDADDCGWLFIDRSRNRSRRWCDMSECGNRAKVRRFRARKES